MIRPAYAPRIVPSKKKVRSRPRIALRRGSPAPLRIGKSPVGPTCRELRRRSCYSDSSIFEPGAEPGNPRRRFPEASGARSMQHRLKQRIMALCESVLAICLADSRPRQSTHRSTRTHGRAIFSNGVSTLPSVIAAALILAACHQPAAQAENWPRFRGTNGTGVSDLSGVPTEWTEDDYEWVVSLPGIGHASPVVWDDALFITTGDEDGLRTLYRLDASTGEQVWSRSERLDTNHLHVKNSYASSTPAVDGERVYVIHADFDQQWVIAYTMDGEEVWRYDVGPFVCQHGQGVSPIVYNETLIVANDQREPGVSSLLAFDRRTGDVIWQSPRESREVSYSTPFVLERADHDPQLICLSGVSGLTGYDPETGEELWTTPEMPLRTVACPVYGNGLILASCGSGGIGKYLMAVDPDAADGTAATLKYERLQAETLNYVPTPIVLGEYVYLWCDRGMICCVEMATGRTAWKERIGGNYSGSPILIDGYLYCMSEEGEVVVVEASPGFSGQKSSPLGVGSHSTPAVGNGRVYFRGFDRLACLKAGPQAAAGN
ncbi:MAG: hypothetical protein DWQ29_17730 [Planctomycetota bacterium]|nr:MAG: hypothetical protein DWQ29_17730 [Planctomycetota bacterium]